MQPYTTVARVVYILGVSHLKGAPCLANLLLYNEVAFKQLQNPIIRLQFLYIVQFLYQRSVL